MAENFTALKMICLSACQHSITIHIAPTHLLEHNLTLNPPDIECGNTGLFLLVQMDPFLLYPVLQL